MKSAKLPDNELERLQALYQYDVLDTEAERVFDDLTELASQICETPICLISLVDPDRQWFKSKFGLDAQQTSREIAFCSHAILQDELFEIPNASEDERFFDNPLVTGAPDIRFYAGMPLKTPSGHNIGTLCVISEKPKVLTKQQRSALIILAREVISQLELRIQNKKLALANSFKTQFLSNVSHEIRTPLNAIIGLSDLLLHQKSLCDVDQQAKEYIQQIAFSGERLLGIINSVLDLGKIESGNMELEPQSTDLAEVMDKNIALLSVKAKQKGVQIISTSRLTAPTLALIDATKLSQIFTNLLNNAIKFTPENRQIFVNYSIYNNELEIEIKDQGVGISEADQASLFNKYVQVGKQKSAQEGTGLGLSITKGLVELMGGQITLSSRLGQGSTFRVCLPIDLVASPTVSPAVAHQGVLPSDLKVLIVEDNKVNQLVLEALLDQLNVSHDTVDTGEASLVQAQQNRYDLILMDINLPGISGLEATKQLKQAQLPSKIVALTADVFCRNDEKALFDDFLTKPIQIEGLRQALHKLF
ncbi:GAF domain-containing hybrid sensor histidine kinase/response regulator [Motilimonas eburnea]|uniref:GAF domain-containing hybrid sensor histidine kinase/response regulator n=1 Tax=Motilimonas eburnea TaxID=1737488 RepID=UPI001E3544D8|nr:GAF domain-containing hybrid sensor histidine kinase/response regulator [Motilimonas eburnea]MCE2570455.1 response regulator [Motilimonas eburnea]